MSNCASVFSTGSSSMPLRYSLSDVFGCKPKREDRPESLSARSTRQIDWPPMALSAASPKAVVLLPSLGTLT